MTRIGRAVLLAAVIALLVAGPAAAADPASGDPLRALGGDSPLCAHPVTVAARESCRVSGAIEHPYPLDRYRFDWHIKTGLTRFDGNLSSALQYLVSLLWQAVLWAAKGILLVFQWAFSLDLLGAAMDPVRRTLERLHTSVFGRPWLLAAISLLGLWGLWNGVLRRRTIATVSGLAAALVMMAGALAVIAEPAGTVGAATRAVNDTKLAILAGATHGTVTNTDQSVADASRAIFDTIVLRPWCAVQFGDVHWCLTKTPGDHLTRAERWLRYPSGSQERDAEYQVLADPEYDPGSASLLGCDRCAADDEALKAQFVGYRDRITLSDRGKVAMQQQDRTLFRTGLVALVLIGVAGWVALIGFLAVQSLLQAMLGLVLLLGAPVMLLAPAFGDRGRSVFCRWALRLLASVVSGALYALLLAITIAVAEVIADLDAASSWLAAWLLQLVFLWGVFFKRRDLLAWLSAGTHRPAGATRFSELQAKRRTLQQAAAPALAIAGTPVAALVAGGRRATTETRAALADRTQAVQRLAGDQLRTRARQQLQTKYDAHHARLTAHDDAHRTLPELRRRRDKLDRQLESPKLDDQRRTRLQAERGRLTGQIRALEPRLMPRAEEGVARRFIETADRNHIEHGERFTDGQLDAQLAGLRDDVNRDPDPDGGRHAWRLQTYRPGLPEGELAKLPAAERADLHRQLQHDLERDRALFAALPDTHQQRPTRAGRRRAQAQLPTAAVAHARRHERAQRLAQTDGGPLHNVRARHADRQARRPPPPT